MEILERLYNIASSSLHTAVFSDFLQTGQKFVFLLGLIMDGKMFPFHIIKHNVNFGLIFALARLAIAKEI